MAIAVKINFVVILYNHYDHCTVFCLYNKDTLSLNYNFYKGLEGDGAMQRDTQRQVSLTIKEELYQKLRYACNYEGRTVSSQIRQYIRYGIADFEEQYGKIEPCQMEPLKKP